jgi:hypothetical protein
MKPILKLVFPSVIAVLVIVPSMLIRIPCQVQIGLRAKHLSFITNQDANPSVISFESFRSDQIELTDFDHVLLEGFGLYSYPESTDSVKVISEGTNIRITPIEGRLRRTSKLFFQTEKEQSLFVQTLQSANNAKIQFVYQSEDWLLFQVDEPIDSINMEYRPILDVTNTGNINLSIDRCNVSKNGNKIDKISKPTANIILKPTSDYNRMRFYGEENKIRMRIHLPSAEYKNYSKVEVYNPDTDRWESDLAVIPTPRQHAVTAVVDDQIYVIGGDVKEDKIEIVSNIKVNDLEFLKYSKHQDHNVEQISIEYEKKVQDNIEAGQAELILKKMPYNILNINLSKKHIICLFDGSTKGGRIDTGIQDDALSPTLLIWIYRNQFLAAAFGAIIWLIGTLYFLFKEWENIQQASKIKI